MNEHILGGAVAETRGKCEGYRKDPSVPLNVYIEEKITMLRNDFFINMSESDLEHIRNLKTEEDVDAYVHQLFMERL